MYSGGNRNEYNRHGGAYGPDIDDAHIIGDSASAGETEA
jgi:hypothetical protein